MICILENVPIEIDLETLLAACRTRLDLPHLHAAIVCLEWAGSMQIPRLLAWFSIAAR